MRHVSQWTPLTDETLELRTDQPVQDHTVTKTWIRPRIQPICSTKPVFSHCSDLSTESPADCGPLLLSRHTAHLPWATFNVLTTTENRLLMKKCPYYLWKYKSHILTLFLKHRWVTKSLSQTLEILISKDAVVKETWKVWSGGWIQHTLGWAPALPFSHIPRSSTFPLNQSSVWFSFSHQDTIKAKNLQLRKSSNT